MFLGRSNFQKFASLPVGFSESEMAKFDGIERAESDRSSLVGPGKVQRSKVRV